MNKKVSVIIPVYGTEKYLKKCIQSVIEQSYKNIEIIIVNDCSQDNSQEIIDDFLYKYDHIKCIKLEENGGLYHARLAGFDMCTGDYIVFLDSDDYVSQDAYRSLVQKAESSHSDIVFGNIVIEWEANGLQETHEYNEPKFDILEGPEILERYLDQEGYTFFWYAVWNKLFTRDIFHKARPYFNRITDHTIMAEDVAFCTVLLAMAKRVSYIEYYTNYYLQSSESSTSISNRKDKYEKNIKDMCRVMDFVEEFVFEYPDYDEYKEKFHRFKEVFVLYWLTSIKCSRLSKRKKKECLAFLKKCAGIFEFPNHDRIGEVSLTYGVDRSFIYSQSASFDKMYEEIVASICNNKHDTIVIPFDDLLFSKHFMNEDDYLSFLEISYKSLIGDKYGKEYIDNRKTCELSLKNSNLQHISIDEIYNKMTCHGLDNELCRKLKNLEIKLIKRLYVKRQSVKQLFDLAIYLDKKVIIVIKNNLNERIAKEILKENGFDNFQETQLLNNVEKEFISKGSNLINTGNRSSIYFNSTEQKSSIVDIDEGLLINYQKPLNVLFDKCKIFNSIKKSSYCQREFYNNLLNKMSIITIANLYFDNPFKTFDDETDFNKDAYFMGLFPVAMFALNLSIWLASFDKYDEIVFDQSSSLLKKSFSRYNKLSYKCTDVKAETDDISKAIFTVAPYFLTENISTSKFSAFEKLCLYNDMKNQKNIYDSFYLFEDSKMSKIIENILGDIERNNRIFYSEKLIKELMEKGLIDFTDRMISVYDSQILEIKNDHVSMAYPMKYLLYNARFEDVSLFDYCSIYFKKKDGYEEMSLLKYWIDVSVMKPEIMGDMTPFEKDKIRYYPFLHNRPPIYKALFFLLFDRKVFVEKINERFDSNKNIHRIFRFLNRYITGKKYKNGGISDEI